MSPAEGFGADPGDRSVTADGRRPLPQEGWELGDCHCQPSSMLTRALAARFVPVIMLDLVQVRLKVNS